MLKLFNQAKLTKTKLAKTKRLTTPIDCTQNQTFAVEALGKCIRFHRKRLWCIICTVASLPPPNKGRSLIRLLCLKNNTCQAPSMESHLND